MGSDQSKSPPRGFEAFCKKLLKRSQPPTLETSREPSGPSKNNPILPQAPSNELPNGRPSINDVSIDQAPLGSIERNPSTDRRPDGILNGEASIAVSTGPLHIDDGNAPPHLKTPAEAASAPKHATNPHLVRYGSGLLSNKVKCDIILVYNGEEYPDLQGSTIEWLDRSQYALFDLNATRTLREHGVPDTKQLYRKSGRCRLIRDDNHHEVDSRILEDERQWSEVLQILVTSFWRANPYVTFHLEIRWEYSDLAINKIEGERYAVTIQRAIEKKLVQNWKGKNFIPRKDLHEIFSESTIKELISNDRTLQDPSVNPADGADFLDKEKFLKDVALDATRLLAVCVYVDLPLICLLHLLNIGKRDTDLPLNQLHCPKDEYSKKFRDLLMWQWSFIPHEFHDDKGRPKHRKLLDETVVPIFFDREEDKLGEGGFGLVYKVHIDPDHHFLSSDRKKPFALKVFKELGSRTEKDFERESKTLSTLSALPHPHITPHLASWTQDNKFFMLFPCAESNLHNFLRTFPSQELDNAFVSWLLLQLKGLADGVRHIHNLAPSGLGPESLTTKHGRTGFHHDLKPQNILVFPDDNVGDRDAIYSDFSLKISDFGTAKISDVLSHSGWVEQTSYKTPNLTFGDTVYGAPDYALMGETSRPYDVWSLGCVFLEILLWTFRLSGSDLNEFSFERIQTSDPKGNQTPAFWFRDSRDKILLKPAVVRRLKQLQEYCKRRGVFEHIVRCTAKMLTINPNKRLTALEVYNVLDTQLLQAQVDLRVPDFYREAISEQNEVAAPPTVYKDPATNTSRSGSPSIDERSIYAPEDGYLRVQGSVRRRPSLPSARRETGEEDYPNGVVTPERKTLSPLNTQDLPPANGHHRSPSIEISDHDAPTVRAIIFDDLRTQDHAEVFPPVGSDPPIGSHQYSMGREDFSRSRLRRSRSNDSRRTMSSDF